MTVRRTKLTLIYEGTDISPDIEPDLLSFEFSDKESGESDEISITLKDEHELWHTDWFPGKGDRIKATINDVDFGDLYCGQFEIDEISLSTPPTIFSIKAVSVPLVKSIRRTKKSRTWEEAQLSEMVDTVADEGGLQLIYDVSNDPLYTKQIQREETDLAFLKRLCDAEGFSLKVSDTQLIVFEQKAYENKPSILTFERGTDDIKSASFKTQAYDLYKICVCSYYDEDNEQEIKQTFRAPNVDDGYELNITKVASSFAEAERWARAELRKKNKHEVTGDITFIGNIDLVAGINIDISGFGKFDGKYLIENARHTVGNGYTTQIRIRKVLEDY